LKNNYLNYAIDSNGKLVRWNKDKINVYVEDSEYKNSIYKALIAYNSTLGDYFTIYLAKDRENSDIKIDIVDKFSSNDNHDSIYMAGITNNSFSGSDKHLTNSVIQILSKKPNSDNKVSNSEVYKVALHEIGHAIGIIGHSPNSSDVMYASSSVSNFSARDIATIKLMYSGDNTLIKSETKNFAQTKLTEAEEYAKKSPNKAISWVNLGKVYYDLDKKEQALSAYKRALSIEPNNPLIYQSMAECYYSSLKYNTAIKYYNIALENITDNEQKAPIYNMIGMCYAKQDDFNSAYAYFKNAYEIDSNNRMLLKNYIVACVEIDKKQEALSVINDYKSKYPDIVNEDFVKDVLNWAK
ncbi:tetratricopeptide repeat protein, partial [bacterium]|nr:tetratricopeptide repeat protein [bacterium]